jgi:hypothetical protein
MDLAYLMKRAKDNVQNVVSRRIGICWSDSLGG